MVYGIVCLIAVILLASILVGALKGYTRTKTWVSEFFFAALFTVLIYKYTGIKNDILNAALSIGTAIVLLLLFAFFSKMIKVFFKSQIASARKRSYYETYGEREENTLQILDAIELDDEDAYRELTKRKMKEKSGPAGVFNRIFGALNLFIKALIIMIVVAVTAMFLMHLTQLPFVSDEEGALYSFYASEFWQWLSPYILDFMVVGIIQFAIRAGYRAGIIRAIWMLFLLILVIAAMVIAYYLSFRVDSFVSLATGLANKISISQRIAKIVIMVGLFVIEFAVILTGGLIISGVLNRAREDAVIERIDGIAGAIIITALCIVLMMFFGMLLYSFNDFEFMETFNSYCYYTKGEELKSTAIFSTLYDRNILNGIEAVSKLQGSIASLFGG